MSGDGRRVIGQNKKDDGSVIGAAREVYVRYFEREDTDDPD